MKSLYLRILLWCLGTLLASLVAFNVISRSVQFRAAGKGGPMMRVDALFLRQAIQAYEMGGASGLSSFLADLGASLSEQRYVTDARGRDLATGVDRSGLLAMVHEQWGAPVPQGDHIVVVQASPDNRYRLITILEPPLGPGSLVPYFLLIAGAVAVVCWALAISIASPLRELSRSVERFGRGELSLRLSSQRHDEIGELSRSFDHMAERIGTLLTAERRLLQDVSHELRSPLARMSFAVELARREENRDAALDRIKTEIQRLSGLVTSLLEVTRSEGDPLAQKQESFRVVDLLHDIAEDCVIEADARQCRVVVAATADPNIMGNRELLRRAFENIVRNAITYAPAQSPVEISLKTTNQSASVNIRDYGAGVPEDSLGKLGEPFFRVDDSRNGSTGGVGLGLAIAQRAIGIHHGSLRIENAHPGLNVSVDLPLPG